MKLRSVNCALDQELPLTRWESRTQDGFSQASLQGTSHHSAEIKRQREGKGRDSPVYILRKTQATYYRLRSGLKISLKLPSGVFTKIEAPGPDWRVSAIISIGLVLIEEGSKSP